MLVYVVIVTYNGLQWIDKCIRSLEDNALKLKIIVIDNGSTDGTVKYIRECFPFIHIIEAGKNLGFGKANNIGIGLAIKDKADYIFLLNQDAWVEKNAISKLVEIQKKNPKCGIISPLHLNGFGNNFDKKFLLSFVDKTNDDFIKDLYFDSLPNIYKVPFVNAAAWLISRNCVERVGGFDPLFFHYGEDDNYCQRVRYHGLEIAIAPSTFICHDRDDRGINVRMEFASDNSSRTALIYVCNPFLNTEKELPNFLRKLFVIRLKHIIKMDWNEYKATKKAERFIKVHKEEIIEHVNRNKIGGNIWI